jgi:predicted ATPase/class 3 adenylate cyclase
MQFEVLGPLRVVGTHGDPVAIPSGVQRRLLSLLILRAGTPVSADYLAECMDVSGGALRVAVSRLRRLVGFATLVTAPPGYELCAESIDARAFEDLLARAGRDNGTARRALEDALGLWRGDAYAEFADEEWALPEVRRLSELRAGATEDLVERMLDAGEWTAAIAAVEPLISEQPFRDRPRGLLMRALADSGRRIDALRTYQNYRQTLLDEVGTEPSETITLLDREIARSGATDIVPRWSPNSATGESVGTFLFTDIVGSTRLWAEHAEAMSVDLAAHDDVLSCAIADHGGMTISKGGDSFAAAFERADDAVAAAVAAQQLLAATAWQLSDGVSVRMGVHVGAAQRRGDGWYGPPLNEAARMMAVAHGGQVVVSERVARIVSDVRLLDLGEHRLRDLDGTHHLFQVLAPGLPTEFPSLSSMSRYVTTLPTQRTELVGRDELTARVRALLLEQRLVTLLGPGGVGKTRVAVEVAGQELENYPDGVFFVDLTTAASGADVVAAFVTGIRTTVPPDQEAEAYLAKYLAERRAFLVADNCEHVVDRVAEVLDGLLSAAPELRVLATSRETLDLDGEYCVVVPSLEVDGVRSAGACLFTERALAVDDSFVVDEAALETVAEIARRLDGIPLAIELAAAQTRTLTPSQILTHLDDRFQFLRRGNRQAPARQRTLEATVAWSYELLDADEPRAVRLLAVCAGRFSLATAARLLEVDEVTALHLLDALVTKSLIVSIRFGGESHGYRFLETLRDYGRRELSRSDELAAAKLALESALVPPPELLDDWMELENGYFFASDVAIIIEDVTRRAAAMHALEAGRLDAAALISVRARSATTRAGWTRPCAWSRRSRTGATRFIRRRGARRAPQSWCSSGRLAGMTRASRPRSTCRLCSTWMTRRAGGSTCGSGH